MKYLAGAGAFDITLVSICALTELGIRDALAIAVWIGLLALLARRSVAIEAMPRATVVRTLPDR